MEYIKIPRTIMKTILRRHALLVIFANSLCRRIMAFSLNLILVSSIIMFSTLSASAEENYASAWLADKHRVQELNSEKIPTAERLQRAWDILWPWAKKGNLDARVGILYLMVWEDMELPGRSGDYLSRMRDAIILSVHSVGAEEDSSLVDISYQQLKGLPGTKDFFDCINKNRSQSCADTLVRHGRVPSFNAFAAEIDMFLANGKTVTVTPSFDPKSNNINKEMNNDK